MKVRSDVTHEQTVKFVGTEVTVEGGDGPMEVHKAIGVLDVRWEVVSIYQDVDSDEVSIFFALKK